MRRITLREVFGVEEPQYLVGMSYEIWQGLNYDAESPIDKGWELKHTPSTTTDLKMIADTYGIEPNRSDMETRWTNDNDPQMDWMTNDETYYQMSIKHLDGSDLSREERAEINSVLSG